MPKVSVVVPVYNVEKYIEKCIISIKNQTLKDYECLIIDDGSPDNSIEVAKKVIGSDLRFIILSKENGGLSDAKNFGKRAATGDYICFIDSDDYIDETCLEKAYNMAIKHDSDITCFDLYYEYENGNKEISLGGYQEVDSYSNNKNIAFINNSSNNKLYRTSFMKDKEFIKGMWYEDLAIVPIWLSLANNVSYVNEPLYYYLQREGSISHSADKRIFDIYKALDNVKTKLNLKLEDMKDLYLDNCVIMTTLRIRDIEDKKLRKEFYINNLNEIEKIYPSWYEDLKERGLSIKQKIVYKLLKIRNINLLNVIF